MFVEGRTTMSHVALQENTNCVARVNMNTLSVLTAKQRTAPSFVTCYRTYFMQDVDLETGNRKSVQ
jgi:hypothetical protein